MKERRLYKYELLREKRRVLFAHILPVDVSISADERRSYGVFQRLPSEDRSDAFQRMTPEEQLAAVLVSAKTALSKEANITAPFLHSPAAMIYSPSDDKKLDLGLSRMEVFAEVIHVLQRIQQEGSK